ncbi:MAG: WxcM-like domain-containing protein [Anaerotruncus sp.]|nr:WxcM-like domain-containing protein [Anaerotruncus sp.]
MIACKRIAGELGALTAIEGGIDIPFNVHRVYYITDVPREVKRGFHAHRRLEQVLFCLHGSVKIRIKTPYEEEVIPLCNDSNGLYIGHMVWREMFDFSPGAALLVLASEHYTETDYIRDDQQYIKEASDCLKQFEGEVPL